MKQLSCEAAVNAMIDSGLKLKKEKALKILFKLYEKYGIEFQKIFQKFLKKTLGRIDFKILANGIAAYRRMQTGFLSPYPGVRPTLVALKEKGVKIGIISDAPRLKAWLRLSEMNLSDFFDVVITAEDSGKKKPHIASFKLALKKLKVKPQEALFVGDWPERDIKGAKQAGMKTVFAKYGLIKKYAGTEKKFKADYEIHNVKELLKIVK